MNATGLPVRLSVGMAVSLLVVLGAASKAPGQEQRTPETLFQEILRDTNKTIPTDGAGELFGCVNSGLPGGCGRSIHCSGCALRRAITATYHSREPQAHVPATLRRGDPDDPSAVAITLSTSMRGDAVLVKIDRLDW